MPVCAEDDFFKICFNVFTQLSLSDDLHLLHSFYNAWEKGVNDFL
jgi:hypothetical protein